MNTIVVFEDQATKQCQEGKPYPFATTLDVWCLCGNPVHPIPGAWCTRCGAKVVDVRQEEFGFPAQDELILPSGPSPATVHPKAAGSPNPTVY